jgi:hypothetical protein
MITTAPGSYGCGSVSHRRRTMGVHLVGPRFSYDPGGSAVLHAMNGCRSLKDPTCPIDEVILWWISSTDWFDPHGGSVHSGVWWCHRCERSFMGAVKGLTEVGVGWPYGARDAHARQPQLAS